MIFTKIILQDYGVYRGKNEFDFTCTKDKPIILVGGTNGAGKTTLFESVMLCLYGISTMEKRSTRKSYEAFLARKIHRNTKDTIDSSSITVQFQFFHDGKEIEYKVHRTWSKIDSKLKEHLFIYKRHSECEKFESLDTVEESHWQSFIEDLIPKGVARLFFFDGEKIVKIAKEGIEDITIKDSLQSLLGLDMVEQLRADLQVNLVRNLTNGGSLQEEYEKLKTQKAECLDNNTRLEERFAQKQNIVDALQSDIESLESKISKIGGTFTSKREQAKIDLASKKATYESIKKTMQDQCASILPFSLIPVKLNDLAKQIERDNQIIQKKLGDDIVESKIVQIKKSLSDEEFWKGLNLDYTQSKQIKQKLLSLFELEQSTEIPDEMFGFSTMQSSAILQIIQDSNSSALDAFAENTSKLIVIAEEIDKLEQIIANAAADDEVGPMISQLGHMNADLGEINSEMSHIEEKISANVSLSAHIDSKIRKIISEMYQDEKVHVRVNLTKDVQIVLDEFVEKLRIKKLKILEDYLLEALGKLFHKKDFIKKVAINSETFEITLYGKDDELIPKDLLSEGEKQMFATALLWALAKTSGRPLPFMIDTPLARLDAAHRTNIVKKFLPLASHQVLIFSTDKEIEYDYYDMLKPYMMRSYVMQFIHEEKSTEKHEGYFWNDTGEKIVAVS